MSSTNDLKTILFFTDILLNFDFIYRKNVGYASTCNSVGVPFGMFIGSVCFTLLVSEQFNATYFRATPGTGGLITMKSTKIKK